MAIFALQSPAGGFIDEDLQQFNKEFDEWCAQFETYDDAELIADSLEARLSVKIVEITPLSYPKYFFHELKGTIHATREVEGHIICIVEPFMGSNYRIVICNLANKTVRLTPSKYKSVVSVEGAFTHFQFR